MLMNILYTLAVIYGISYIAIIWFFVYSWIKGIQIFEDDCDYEEEHRQRMEVMLNRAKRFQHHKRNDW